MAKSVSSTCPFTLKSIDTISKDDVAIIYENSPLLSPTTVANQCKHPCTLSHLVSYLHDGSVSKLYPAFQASIICDHNSSEFFEKRQKRPPGKEDAAMDGEGRIVSFRYGSTFYFLWVHSSSRSTLFSPRKSNALDRIGYVLGMDVKKGLKVIHKGKIVFPHNSPSNETLDDISEKLLDISSADIFRCRKKPSLVVMGLRQPTTVVGRGTQISTFGNICAKIICVLSPWYLWNLLTFGSGRAIRAASSLIGGICLFVRSILQPPQSAQ